MLQEERDTLQKELEEAKTPNLNSIWATDKVGIVVEGVKVGDAPVKGGKG